MLIRSRLPNPVGGFIFDRRGTPENLLRRSWARNEGAVEAIRREMDRTPGLRVTLPVFADEELVREALNEQGGASDKL